MCPPSPVFLGGSDLLNTSQISNLLGQKNNNIQISSITWFSLKKKSIVSRCNQTLGIKLKLKFWWNSKTQIVMKLKNSNFDETPKLKFWKLKKTLRGTRCCWAWGKYWCKPYFHQILLKYFLADIFLFDANKRIYFCFREFQNFT